VEGCLDLKPPHGGNIPVPPTNQIGWKYERVKTGQEEGNKCSVACFLHKTKKLGQHLNV